MTFTIRGRIDFIRFRLPLPDGSAIERSEHDVMTPRDLDLRISRLKSKYGLNDEPIPVGVELALDATHPDDDLAALADLTARMWRMHTAYISSNQRMYRTKADPVTTPPAHDRLVSKLIQGFQLAEGNQQDDIYRHAYVKTTDDGARRNCQARARIEVRLQGSACPFQTIDGLKGFDWRQLRHWFRFRALRDDLTDLERAVAQVSDTIGKRKPRVRLNQNDMRNKGTRALSRLTKSDETLNRKADDALKVLNRRWHNTEKTSARLGEPAATCPYPASNLPENLGQSEPEGRATAKGRRITTHTKSNNTTTENPKVPPVQLDQHASRVVSAVMALFSVTPRAVAEYDRINRLLDECDGDRGNRTRPSRATPKS